MIASEPDTVVADLHGRMAAILEPHPATDLRAYPVSTAVNDPANDEPALVDPLES